MSKPRRNDRCEWLRERIADATKAAADGQGWTFLAELWNCSNANALQWCKVNVSLEVCQKIGQNGTLRRYPNNGRKYVAESRTRPKPDTPPRQSNGRVYYVSCHHIIPRGPHQGKRCYAPTENGKHACPDCLKEEMTIKNERRDTIRTYID